MSRLAITAYRSFNSRHAANRCGLYCPHRLTRSVSPSRLSFLPIIRPHRNFVSLSGIRTLASTTFSPSVAPPRRECHATAAEPIDYRQVVKERRKLRAKRLANSDSEDRRAARELQVRDIPGFRETATHLGAYREDSVSVSLLNAFLDAKLKELKGSSLTVLMMYCAEAGIDFLPIVERLRAHISTTEDKDHFAISLSYINVLGNYVEDKPELDDELIRHYDEFVSRHASALCSTEVCKELVRAVAQSTAWLKGVYLLGKLKAAKDVRWSDFFHLIMAAAKAGNIDVVMLLQKNFLQMQESLPAMDGIRSTGMVNMCAIWSTLLERIDEMQDEGDLSSAKVYVDKMLRHWRTIGHIPHQDVIDQLASWFKKYYGDGGVVHANVTIPKSGVCPITDKSLERLELLKFDTLKAKFLDDLLVEKNIYVNADPEDMANLSNFIETRGPFDVVIDGLNVCFHDNKMDSSSHIMIRQVLQVAKFLHRKMGKRVAVISRDWWDRAQYRAIMGQMRELASVFLTHKMTDDDLFALHCCLESGPECYIVTNDLLRNHRRKWSDHLRPAFSQWQHARQIHVQYDRESNKMTLVTPRQYLTAVQEVDGTLYIPHQDTTEDVILNSHTQMDLKDGVTVDTHFRIPNTFLVINPEKPFFRPQTLPEFGTV